jgi:hypothetical protein
VVAHLPEEKTGLHLTVNANSVAVPKIRLSVVIYLMEEVCLKFSLFQERVYLDLGLHWKILERLKFSLFASIYYIVTTFHPLYHLALNTMSKNQNVKT